MFPLRDENPTELTPIITFLVLMANVAAWLLLQGAGTEQALVQSVCTYGVIPAEVTGRLGGYAGVDLGGGMRCAFGGLGWEALFTSMFMHGGWLHLIGNMWFLWIFGNNIEDSMGHLRFVVFYLLCGLGASGAQVMAAPGSPVPMVGASGAISGVMGAYLLLYPRVRIHTLFFFFFFVRVLAIPAWFVLGEWFVIQMLGGFMTPAEGGGGVAFWAHVGGFVAGVALIIPFRRKQLVNAKKAHVKLDPREVPHRGWY
ncbi:MAG TPA: rhomboid family intramembrane serine protease [Longimicrobiales bacterium]|nr:rhomboid family intramembrane serine protease [Longimicrobiales bacterium]